MGADSSRRIPEFQYKSWEPKVAFMMSIMKATFGSFLSLPLLVTGILTNHAHRTVAANHLTVLAHLFNRSPNLHDLLSRA